jgi:head-tail adaptor
MRTARTLEAEWRQVLRGSVSTGAKDDESCTGRVWVAGFHDVTARSRLARVLRLESFVSLILKFFSCRVKPRILNQWVRGHASTGMNTA